MAEKVTADQVASFAEWRGTVKAALDYIHHQLDQLREEDTEQWTTLEAVRSQMVKCRDRCDRVSMNKCTKEDLIQARAGCEEAREAVETVRATVATKAEKADLKTVYDKVEGQGQVQVKHAVTMAFFGVIGGGLFTAVIWLLGLLVKGI
jgi:predicted nuclease with TOPRIM domain